MKSKVKVPLNSYYSNTAQCRISAIWPTQTLTHSWTWKKVSNVVILFTFNLFLLIKIRLQFEPLSLCHKANGNLFLILSCKRKSTLFGDLHINDFVKGRQLVIFLLENQYCPIQEKDMLLARKYMSNTSKLIPCKQKFILNLGNKRTAQIQMLLFFVYNL